MITLPNGKICMNEQEAIQWLLDNYPIPFQCSANYAALTEIGLGTIVNPTPAKVKVGSIIFFADSKVSTVVGLTTNGFICSDKYNNLVDDIVYVTNVAINGRGHLITTLSDGKTIDAGIVKQVSSFSINASQHLIVTYNDGTTTDLGAIFNGNINISGNLTVSGGISGNAITGDSIIENMNGYSFTKGTTNNITYNFNFAGVVKNGNKLTFAVACSITRTGSTEGNNFSLGAFTIPQSVADKLYPQIGGVVLSAQEVYFNSSFNQGISLPYRMLKYGGGNNLSIVIYETQQLTQDTTYYMRFEQTFLLSDNLAA